MFDLLKRLQRTAKADISAILLIAFLFQLFTPIVVFADDQSKLGEYEQALRESICQVYLDEDTSSDPTHNKQTDGFVCDWCVLCFADKANAQVSTLWSVWSGPSALITRVDHVRISDSLHAQARGNIAPSRAPPALF